MRKVILLNASAGSAAGAAALRNALRTRPDFVLLEPLDPADTAHLASQAVHAGCDLLLVAGGDGTIHAVVNALAPEVDRVCLGVLPLGTGNDLCRTLAVPNDPIAALAAVEWGTERRLDLIEAHTAHGVYTIVNVASGGFSGQVHEVLTPELKAGWGPLAYLRGAAGALTELHGYATRIRIDEGPVETHEVINVIVANGRYAAHGWRVASPANPEDGLLDVVLVLNSNLFDLTDLATRLLTGDYLDSVSVVHRQAQRVEVAAQPGMWFSLDGELTTNESITFSVRPRALRILVGPEYLADPTTI
jgi:diacylglycerol kinase (ATP)